MLMRVEVARQASAPYEYSSPAATVEIMFFILFLLAVFITIVNGKSGDSAALLSLKNGAGDPLGTLSGWNNSVNCCKWEGVHCSPQHGRVIGLNLQFLTLSSPDLLLSTVHNLSHLRELHFSGSQFTEPLSSHSTLPGCGLEVLDLSNNGLYGSFPTQLVLLDCKDSLRLLNLSHNQLGGDSRGLNYVIGSTLEAIDLSNNNFNGTISSSLFKSCDSLRSFNLSNNGFAGKVPQEMVTHCPVLHDIDLARNKFSGTLHFSNSSSIQRLSLASNFLTEIAISCLNVNVTHLDVSYNKLSGRIFSSSNSACSSLKVLNISTNFFSGPLPSVLGLKLHSSLEVLDASYNSFTDEVPEFHANLKHLDLSSNKFTKTTSSSSICPTGSKLEILLLPNNRLAGPLFNSLLTNCGSLEMLDLSFNALTGEIPDQLCRSLPKLRHLLAWGNGLQGAIPSTLVNCINLTTLILSHNNLTGSIPPQLSGLQNLWWLSLSSNSLSGQIPSSFGELHNLVFLQLNNNSLEGDIPRELDGMKSLYAIELASNLLTGRFPATIGRKEQVTEGTPVEDRFGSLRIARTSGPVCKGSNLLFIVQGIHLPDLSKLLFARTGCFAQLNFSPTFLWNISSPLLLGLSYNQLSGEIPEEIGLMSSLLVLVVAHNKLSGPIPAAVGNLKGIQVLDLSLNALTGRLPDSLSQVTSLFSFNVSYNNLSGPIPQNGQFLTFSYFSYQGNPLLCGLPLSKCSAAGSHVLPPSTIHHESDGGIEDIMVIASVSGVIAFLICFTLTLFCNCPKLLEIGASK